MKENNINENNAQNLIENIDKESIKNLTNNLVKNENSIDFSSLIKLATPLLKNESVLNSVMELSKVKETGKTQTSSESKGTVESDLLHANLEKVVHELAELKKEVTNKLSILENVNVKDLSEIKSELLLLKSQNHYLTGLVEELYNSRKKKKK